MNRGFLARAYIGTAGWAIPRAHAQNFPIDGSTLQRYAGIFQGVEINSTFHRSHRPATYARWAESTPENFRFSLKLPKAITHAIKLVDVEQPLEAFLTSARLLGTKLGPILVQLPPSLVFEPGLATSFFMTLRGRHAGPIVCEPRHASWFTDDADELLKDSAIGRVAADPAVVPAAAEPGGWREPAYYRLHGSPRKYFSAYGEESIRRLSSALEAAEGEVWCIFDNTASGAAAGDALNLMAAIPS
ncbi:MAG TPA: DUF72 domain-containing protein [Gemmatimonadales bacterium]|nr:DUF72 domain-containing protein [Gemmatimonadales bacterium]